MVSARCCCSHQCNKQRQHTFSHSGGQTTQQPHTQKQSLPVQQWQCEQADTSATLQHCYRWLTNNNTCLQGHTTCLPGPGAEHTLHVHAGQASPQTPLSFGMRPQRPLVQYIQAGRQLSSMDGCPGPSLPPRDAHTHAAGAAHREFNLRTPAHISHQGTAVPSKQPC